MNTLSNSFLFLLFCIRFSQAKKEKKENDSLASVLFVVTEIFYFYVSLVASTKPLQKQLEQSPEKAHGLGMVPSYCMCLFISELLWKL